MTDALHDMNLTPPSGPEATYIHEFIFACGVIKGLARNDLGQHGQESGDFDAEGVDEDDCDGDQELRLPNGHWDSPRSSRVYPPLMIPTLISNSQSQTRTACSALCSQSLPWPLLVSAPQMRPQSRSVCA